MPLATVASFALCAQGVHGHQGVPLGVSWCEPNGSTQYYEWLDGATLIHHDGVPDNDPQCAMVDNIGNVTIAPRDFVVTANPGQTKISTFQFDYSLLIAAVIMNSGTAASFVEASVPAGGAVTLQVGLTLNGSPPVTCGVWSPISQMIGPDSGVLSQVISCGFDQAQVSQLTGHAVLTVQGPPAAKFDGQPTIAHLQSVNSQVSIVVPIAKCAGDVAPVWPAPLDGIVNVADLLTVVSSWHECPPNLNHGLPGCPPCVGDTNRDCDVNVRDLLEVINDWGACQ